MSKNLIINRYHVVDVKDRKIQKEYEAKVSTENINRMATETKIPVKLKLSNEYAVFFGTEPDLNKFAKEVKEEGILFEIR